MIPTRVRDAGDSALIVECGEAGETLDPQVNACVVAMAGRIRDSRLPGVRDVLPTFRSVAVFFDPLRTDLEQLRDHVQPRPEDLALPAMRSIVEIPIEYGGDAGPDLEAVAAVSGLSSSEVIARHASRDYRVFMVGFLPGFAYLGPVDASIAAPRHASPRLRVPPGSVGIAGRQTGVYPQASPGGWQIVGRTTTRPFRRSHEPSALLAPGDRVRFVPAAPGSLGSFDAAWSDPQASPREARSGGRSATILQPGLMTTVQDDGRWGHQHEGVPVSGALDAHAMRVANAVVGNPRGAAGLEVTLGGLEVRLDQPGAVAVTGADLGTTLDGRPLPLATRVTHQAGSVIRFGERRAGARAYLACDGGLDVPACLGSRATDLASGLGGIEGRRLRTGDRLSLGAATEPREPRGRVRRAQPIPVGGARLRVLPGPHGEWFPSDALDRLCRTRFEVTSDSNRMGYRLRGATPLPREAREMISDATCPGGLQVPPSGQPILLMADRQVTGGYPIIATVITADLGVAGQLAPGDWIEFDVCTRADALTALADQEIAGDGRD